MRLLFTLLLCCCLPIILLASETIPAKPYFLIGSPRSAVIRVLGDPLSYQPILNMANSGTMRYAAGLVEVDYDTVVNWENFDWGRVGITGTRHSFSLSSSADDVISVIGLPPSAKRLTTVDYTGKGETDLWSYSNSTLIFKDGALIGWNNFSQTLPLLLVHTPNAHTPRLGGNANDILTQLGAPTALIPSTHDISSLWIYKDTVFFLLGDVIVDRATPQLQEYMTTHSNTVAAQQTLAKWLVQQPYLDYHKPVQSDNELYSAFVKQNGASIRAQLPTSAPANTANLSAMSPSAQKRYLKNLQKAQTKQTNNANQQILRSAFQKYLSANFVLIPKLKPTTTATEMKAKLEKLGLSVEIHPQKLGTPGGALYSTFPKPGWHVRPKAKVTLYVTRLADE